jgi:protein-L-isoaspartate(D-aspartate) O-methyltransferase
MDFTAARAKLVQYLSTEITDQRVLVAMGRVPRELFVPAQAEPYAYINEPLSIGCQQTISQPLIIAIMTQALELDGSEKVLEIGTGSGYQAAILAELAREVISTERLPSLAESAGKTLENLGYHNIKIILTRDELGWKDKAPYQAIIVTAGAPQVPVKLLDQLAFGGRMVIPVGSREIQDLFQITKLKERNVFRNLGGCRFVPLINKDAWKD